VPADHLTPEEAVSQVVDVRSLVDTYILHEIVCNPDVGWSSFYITLDMTENDDGRLVFEAPWDFDSAFGIRHDYEATRGDYARYAGNPWLQLFADEPWFLDMVKARWAELKAQGLPEKTLSLITTLTDTYADDFARNYDRWPIRIIEGNHELVEELNRCHSQAEAADYLTRWLRARFAYLDERWQ
jgi:spore coat protein CotH